MARSSSRERIITAALEVFAAAGEDVTIDAVARAAGVTKQGLLYHFADKRELRAAMLATVLERWEADMSAVARADIMTVPVGERVRAYARVSSKGDVVPGEAALFSQILARPEESAPYQAWARRMFDAPRSAARDDRARLHTAWLAANSLWSVLVTRKRRFTAGEVADILSLIDDLTRGL